METGQMFLSKLPADFKTTTSAFVWKKAKRSSQIGDNGNGRLATSYYLYIQIDSGGIYNTLGNDSMCDSKQKGSYEHGSDFERLPRYGKKKIRTILRARTAIT